MVIKKDIHTYCPEDSNSPWLNYGKKEVKFGTKKIYIYLKLNQMKHVNLLRNLLVANRNDFDPFPVK